MRFARASLKQLFAVQTWGALLRYPVRFARASLKLFDFVMLDVASITLSRAFCAGLIEANIVGKTMFGKPCYPVRFARASLKPMSRLPSRTSNHAVIPCVLRGPH